MPLSEQARAAPGPAMISRQQAYQRRQIAAGRCRRCGKLRDGKSKIHCKRCRAKASAGELLRLTRAG